MKATRPVKILQFLLGYGGACNRNMVQSVLDIPNSKMAWCLSYLTQKGFIENRIVLTERGRLAAMNDGVIVPRHELPPIDRERFGSESEAAMEMMRQVLGG